MEINRLEDIIKNLEYCLEYEDGLSKRKRIEFKERILELQEQIRKLKEGDYVSIEDRGYTFHLKKYDKFEK